MRKVELSVSVKNGESAENVQKSESMIVNQAMNAQFQA
jgi:hypothetical protein